MENKSQAKSGFTLLETIISMTIIMILLAGVFNAYIILIKNVKSGEVKQQATLVGKEFVEKIKASSNDITVENGKICLGDDVLIDEESKQGIMKISENGNVADGEDYKYEAVVNLSKKTTENNAGYDTDDFINISSYEDSEENSFVVGDNTIYFKNECPLKKKEYFNITNSLKINIDKDGNGTIGFDGKETKNISSTSIVLDMKYCSSKVDIEVMNNCNNTLKLCILNSTYLSSGERNVDIDNKRGSVNEYYRSDLRDKSGTLYNINIDIYKKGNRKKSLFQSTFVKNMIID